MASSTSAVSEKVVRLIRARVAWANLFARDCPASNTGKLLIAHATRKTRCDKALETDESL